MSLFPQRKRFLVLGGGGVRQITPHPPPPPPVLGAHLEASGQWRGPLPSSVWTRHRAVQQGHSRGSVGTPSQGKGRVCREGRIGQGGRGRAQGGVGPMGTTADGGRGSEGGAVGSGDRPVGASSCTPNTPKVSCQPPPPPPPSAGKRRVALFGHAGNAWCLYPTLIADV